MEEQTTIEQQVLDIAARSPLRGMVGCGATDPRLYRTLHSRRDNGQAVEKLPEKKIPEDDLKVITKIYFKEYPDCGRKRGALLPLHQRHEGAT